MGFSYPFRKKVLWSCSMKGSIVLSNVTLSSHKTAVQGGQKLDIVPEGPGGLTIDQWSHMSEDPGSLGPLQPTLAGPRNPVVLVYLLFWTS